MGKLLKISLIFFRIAILVVPFVLLFWLLYKDFIVSGSLFAVYDFKTQSPFISVLRPQSRVSDIQNDMAGRYFQKILGQPIYFDIRIPRRLDTADITLVYKNIDQPVFELGALVDKEFESYDLKPIENRTIEYLLRDKFRWDVLRDHEILFFQKSKKFSSIDDFLQNLPPQEKIATYNYTIPKDYKMKNFIRKADGIAINKTLRGSHRLSVYIKNEPLDFEIWIQDVNRHDGDDYLSVDVYNKDSDLVYTKFLKPDNNVFGDRKMSEVIKEHILIPDLSEGVYRIELTTPSDDIFFRRIFTKSSHLVFINAIYLGDNVGYSDEYIKERKEPTIIYTNGKSISAKTTHIEGLQTLIVDNAALQIEDTHKKYSSPVNFKFKKIVIPNNDITIETKGLLSFSDKDFFNPENTSLADGSEFDTNAIQYVITKYAEGKSLDDGWKEKKLSFDIAKYYTDSGELHFIISLPYLEKENKGVLLSKIIVELRGQPLSQKAFIERIKRKIKELINY